MGKESTPKTEPYTGSKPIYIEAEPYVDGASIPLPDSPTKIRPETSQCDIVDGTRYRIIDAMRGKPPKTP
jgi:hypothetical protein